MKNIKLILQLLLAFSYIGVFSQTQQGVVKTKGRMVNGRLVAGQGLAGATVTIQGRNAVLSQTNGGFSFPILNKTFMVQGVLKNGYQLVDPDAIRKAYHYSPNIFYIVMEMPDKQSEDELAAERKIRRTLQRQLQQREDELEKLKEQNKLTQEEYREALKQLYDNQKNNESLISEMAKRYAELDYDQLNELNREISDCILNGELTRADSLLRTKGDIKLRIAELENHRQTNAEVKADLEKSEALAEKKKEELAEDCYNRHELFLARHENDSAAYYLELRARLDTTNIDWQYDAGRFISVYLTEYNKARYYYEQVVKEAVRQHGGENDGLTRNTYNEWVSKAYNNIGFTYYKNGNNQQALDYYFKALDVFKINHAERDSLEKAFWKEVEKEREEAANNPDVEFDIVEVDNIEPDFVIEDDTLDIGKIIDIGGDIVISLCNNIGTVYLDNQEYDKALECYQTALNIIEYFSTYIPTVSSGMMVTIYNNIGYAYFKQGEYIKAIEIYEEALKKDEDYNGGDCRNIAPIYSNLADIYYKMEDYERTLEYGRKTWDCFNTEYGEYHNNLVHVHFTIGGAYFKMKKYEETRFHYDKAAMISLKHGGNPLTLANIYGSTAHILMLEGDSATALGFLQKELELRTLPRVNEVSEDSDEGLTVCYERLFDIYYQQHNLEKSIESLEALVARRLQLKSSGYKIINAYDTELLGLLYDEHGNYPQALANFEKALELYQETMPDSISYIKRVQESILETKYQLSIFNGNLKDYMADKIFTITTQEGNTPARQQGLFGEYYLLEFADWNLWSPVSLYAKSIETNAKPIDIVIMRDNIIKKYHFEDKIGITFHLQEICKEKKEHILTLYNNWKK